MATVINKNTLQLILSANTPDFDSDPDWIVNPDLTAVLGPAPYTTLQDPLVEPKYWKYPGTGTAIVEMNALEKAEVDLRLSQESIQKVELFNVKVKNQQLTTSANKTTSPNDPYMTHNMADPPTWAQGSQRLSDVTLTRVEDYNGNTGQTVYRAEVDGSPGTYHVNWIDVHHGRVSSIEAALHADYGLSITVDGTPQNMDLLWEPAGYTRHYTTNFEEGYIEFVSDPGSSAVVVASLSVAQTSKFVFTPPPGKAWRITQVELQFGDSAYLVSPVHFKTTLWVPDGNGDPLVYVADATQERVYQTKRQLLNEANYHYDILADVNTRATNTPGDPRDLAENIRVHGWDYVGDKILNSQEVVPGIGSLVTRLEVFTGGDIPSGGDYVVLTLYVVEVDSEDI